ncbi:MAG: hypothetical protein O3C21_04685 [Verrucomicrobia bacterium]|nr:hypothetical protein [Verrucomicrobiota bacterium]
MNEQDPSVHERQWMCFRLMSPDLPYRADVFAFAAAGSVRVAELKRIVVSARRRQHLTLRTEGPRADHLAG